MTDGYDEKTNTYRIKKPAKEKIMDLFKNDHETYKEIEIYLQEKYNVRNQWEIKDGKLRKQVDAEVADLQNKIATRRYKVFMSDFDEEIDQINIFTFSDSDGDFESALEHGGIFDNFDHVTFSHH